MSVQVRRRREAAAFLSTFVGAQGELLIDTTNNRVQVHDGATPGGWPAAKLADVIARTAVADANYQALSTDRTIAFTALTAARTVTLPASTAYSPGTQLLVVDETGACSFANTITIARTGTDTIDGGTSAVVNTPYGFLALTCNGAGKWTIVDFTGATVAQLTNRNIVINGNFAINQRGFTSGSSVAANGYAHDRWKGGTTGCNYTFTQAVPDTTITITGGSLIQAVDAPNVYTTSYWLTWTGTATARVWQGTATGTFSSGTAVTVGGTTVNALVVTGLTIGTIANLEFQAGPNGGTLGLVQFEAALPNAGPTRFERRLNELAICQAYFWATNTANNKGTPVGSTMGQAWLNYALAMSLRFPVTMRATPTVTLWSNGVNGQMRNSSTGAFYQLSPNNFGSLTAAGFPFMANSANTGLTAGNFYDFDLTASAEL